MADPFNLQRFMMAQTPVIDIVRDELTAGLKRTHWMWYVFPQIAGLGQSAMSRIYAISGRTEAQAFLAHLSLGPHLVMCTRLVLGHEGRSAVQIFGQVDAGKFCSSMTLFAEASGEPVFKQALDKYFAGVADGATLARL
jgi:uncharacterized protein (DUF1810 family)